MANPEASARRRSGGRRGASRARVASAVQAVTPLVNTLPLTEVISEEGIAKIHKASMRLLSDIGVLILDYPEAKATFAAHGAKVEGDLVKIDEDTLMHFVKKAPATFTQLARNPQNNIMLGGNTTVFAPVYGPPYVANLDTGRRIGTLEDFHNFAKLTSMIPHLHHGGGTLCEPNDVPVDERHLDMLLAHATLHDKAFMGSAMGEDHARDTVIVSEILFGKEAIAAQPATLSLINVSSPLRYDDRMLGALRVYAENRQAVIVAAFIVMGAMSPSTIAATLAQQNAETLFGIAYAQMLNPGTPCIQGVFLPTIDMKSGAPSFGTPEGSLALCAAAQLARHYNLPFRSGGNFTASRIPDAQAGYESSNTIWPTVQAGVNFVLHAAGWLEGGMISGYEKLILDAEQLGITAKYVKGIGLTEEDFGFDAFEEVGPGGHFLGAAHTMRHYETAFYQHTIFNMDNYEKWEEEGGQTAYQRANAKYKEMLAQYEQPQLAADKLEELEAFIAQRRTDIQASKPRQEWPNT